MRQSQSTIAQMVEKTGTLNIPTAPIFRPLLDQARYKAAYGGRGSAKSHFFGEMLVEECVMVPGTRAVCLREFQRNAGSHRRIDQIARRLPQCQYRGRAEFLRTLS